MPQVELSKVANQRCKHQRHTGCSIYSTRPMSCRLWSCRWLTGDDTATLSRPDISHYVVDIMPDFVTAIEPVTGKRHKFPAIQVWLDPRHPEGHRDPELRAFLDRQGQVGLIRLSSDEGFVLVPPSVSGDGWIENHDGISEQPHSAAEVWATIPEQFESAVREIPNLFEKESRT